MARGDVKFFAAFFQKALDGGGFDINAGDVIRLGIVNNVIVPSVSTTDPRWGAGGGANFAPNQVALGTAYAGPITLANVVFTRTNGVIKFDFDDVAIAQDVTGFTDGQYAIVYNDSVVGKFAIGFIDLGGPVSIQGGALSITLNAAGFGTLTAS